MALPNLEPLLNAAITRLGHSQHPVSGGGAPGALAATHALSIARLVTTLALILLWFAGELERFAGESAPQTELESTGLESTELESTANSDEVSIPAEPLMPEPVRCRWCREMVICHPDGAVFDLSEGAHFCGLDKILGHPNAPPARRKPRHKK